MWLNSIIYVCLMKGALGIKFETNRRLVTPGKRLKRLLNTYKTDSKTESLLTIFPTIFSSSQAFKFHYSVMLPSST